MEYIRLEPDTDLPDISTFNPFRVLVIVEEAVTSEWQKKVSTWLVTSGCLYMMAWGIECSSWDDSVDYANIEYFNYENIPDNKFVMTTWHENESIEEVFLFSKNDAIHPSVDLKHTFLIHISNCCKKNEYTNKYISV